MRKPASLLALILCLGPLGAFAVGLGDIESRSALNEPLDASITLRVLKPGDVEDMKVRLASREQFTRAGIDRTIVLTRLRFAIRDLGNGQGEISVTTKDPVTEPFLNFLVDVDWSRGRVIREYTLLLDPPIYGAAIQSVVKQSVTTVDDLPAASSEATQTEDQSAVTVQSTTQSTTSSASAAAPSKPAMAPGSYGPVKSTDTLWSLAQAYRPGGATVQQTMLAMLRANPEAFGNGNINNLRAGAVLRVPDEAEIAQLSAAEALAEVKSQHAQWEEYRQSAGASVSAAPDGGDAPTQDMQATDSDAVSDSETTSTSADDSEARLEVLGSGDTASGAGGAASADLTALQDELTMAQEEADSQRHENEDLQSKLAEADEIIEQLQRMVDVKDNDIAALQDKLAEIEAELADTATAPVVDDGTMAEVETDTSDAAVVETVEDTAADTDEQQTEVAKSKTQPPQSFLDKVLAMVPGDPLVLGAGAGGVVLLALLGVLLARRRKSKAEWVDVDVPEDISTEDDHEQPTELPVEEAETEAPALADTPAPDAEDVTMMPDTAGDKVAAMTLVADTEEDPLEGLNIYLAYEDYDNATKLVEGVIEKHPERHEYKLRLLEIFYAAKNLAAFETAARALQGAVGDDSALMESARSWWNELSPDRALFAEGAAADVMALDGEAGDEAIFDVTADSAVGRDDTMEISLDDVEADGDGGGVDFDLGFEFESPEFTDDGMTGDLTQTVDFDLGDDTQGQTESEDAGGVDIDFDLSSALDEPEAGVDAVAEESTDSDSGLDFSLDLDDTAAEIAEGAVAEPETPGGDTQAFGSGLAFGETIAPDDEAPSAADEGIDFELETGLSDDAAALDDSGSIDESVEFALDLEAVASDDGEVDFALDLDETPTSEAESEPPAPSDEEGLDFALDLEESGDEVASVDSGDELDFALDVEEAVSDEAAVPASIDDDDGLDFALDVEESADDLPATPASTGEDDGLDFALDVEETGDDEAAAPVSADADDGLDFALDMDETLGGEADELEFSLDPDETVSGEPTPDSALEGADDVDFALDMGDSLQGEATPASADGDADELDFAFDLDDMGAAGEPLAEAPAMDDSVDFSFDLDETGTEADGAADAAIAGEDGLDFSMDLDESSESAAPSEADSAASADADEGLEFDLGTVSAEDESTPDALDFPLELDDDAGVVQADAEGLDFALDDGGEFEPETNVEDTELDLGLDAEPAVASTPSQDPESTQYMLRDVPPVAPPAEEALDLDLGVEGADEDGDGTDTVYMVDQPAQVAGGEDALDFTLDEPTSGESSIVEAAMDADEEMDFNLEIPGSDDTRDEPALDINSESTQYLLREPASDDALDISFDDLEAPTDDSVGELDIGLDGVDLSEQPPDFETVQLNANELARVGAIDDSTGTHDDASDEIEVDGDFADIFSDDDGEDSALELPDSAAVAEEADVSDVSELDFDLDSGEVSEDTSESGEYQQTQYMLRDIAAITSDTPPVEDEEDRTLVLGRGGSGGEVDEMQTKLDLAQAYIDMGDTEGARGILGEVMAEGSDGQQETARNLLNQLN